MTSFYKSIRENRKLSQKQVAELLGVSQATVSKREKSDKIITNYDNKYHEVIASIPLRKVEIKPFEETEVSELMYGMSGEEMDAEADRIQDEIDRIQDKIINVVIGVVLLIAGIGVIIYLFFK